MDFSLMVGNTFQELTVLEFLGRNKSGRPICRCRCSCGSVTTRRADSIATGRTSCCGCKTGRPRIDMVARFWSMVSKRESCWVFDTSRYGKLTSPPPTKRCLSAHRLSWALHFGKVPDGLFVCHKCNNKACVRPDHLYLATPKQNHSDAIRDGLSASWAGSNNPKWKDGRRMNGRFFQSRE